MVFPPRVDGFMIMFSYLLCIFYCIFLCKIISNNFKDYLLTSIFFHTFVTCFDKHVHFYLLNRYSNWTLEM